MFEVLHSAEVDGVRSAYYMEIKAAELEKTKFTL